MQDHTAQTSLQIASAIIVAFGIVTAAAAHPQAAGITTFLVDLMFWPVDGAQSLAAPEARLLSAIGGGVTAGWGVMLWLVSTRLYGREPALTRSIILTSIATWFVIDSTCSILAGAPFNALLNVGFLLLFWVPLRGANALRAA